MKTRSWVITIGVIIIAILVIIFWPASDPFAGVKAVSIAGIEGTPVPPNVRDSTSAGLEITLKDRQIKIVANAAEADATLEIKLDETGFQLDKNGLRISTVCILTKKNGERHVMDLYITVDQEGIQAKLVERKFWQVWK